MTLARRLMLESIEKAGKGLDDEQAEIAIADGVLEKCSSLERLISNQIGGPLDDSILNGFKTEVLEIHKLASKLKEIHEKYRNS